MVALPNGPGRHASRTHSNLRQEKLLQISRGQPRPYDRHASNLFRYIPVGGCSWKLARPIENPDPSKRIVAVLLQVHLNMNVTTLIGMSFTSEVSFDELLPKFRAITNLAASIIGELLGSSHESAFYRFDLGILPALYLVGIRFRDRIVRGRGIKLMLSSQIREGLWDLFCVGSISHRIRMIEEEGGLSGEDFIPESRPVFNTNVNADCGRSSHILAVYLNPNNDISHLSTKNYGIKST